MNVEWIRCGNGANWCPFETVDLSGVTATGVYIIWKPALNLLQVPRVIRVGQGNIADRIAAHRADPAIAGHGPGLRVTWAAVDVWSIDGVENYLATQLLPVVGDRFPVAIPIPVNLPNLAAA